MSTDLDALVKRAPERYQKNYRAVLSGKAGRLMAVKMKCLECCAWERHEGGHDKIGGCSVRSCPLWAYRPFQAESLHRAQNPRQPRKTAEKTRETT